MPLKIVKELPKKEAPQRPATHILAVAAGKGGVGKSSLSALLALSYAHMGLRVGLLDADIYGPSLRRMVPEDTLPGKQGEWIIPAQAQGIALLSLAFFRQDARAVAVRAPIANGVITQFLQQVQWGNLDILIIDFPPGTGDIHLTLSQRAALSGALIVTTPQEVALIDVRRCLDMFSIVQVPIVGIVENMSYYQEKDGEKSYIFGRGGGERLAYEVGAPLLAQIPLDPFLGRCLDQGRSLFLQPQADQSQKIFLDLAQKIWSRLESAVGRVTPKYFLKNNRYLSVEWSTNRVVDYPAAALQKQCPCSACTMKTADASIAEFILGVEPVGHYGVRFRFDRGCSSGLYAFSLIETIPGVVLGASP